MPVAPTRPPGSAGAVIAIDPHKASWTAVVVNGGLTPVAALRVEVNRAGYRLPAAASLRSQVATRAVGD
jgi:hypothetical protein